MICPVCGESELVKDVRDMEYTYKDKNTLVLKVAGDYCPNCNEAVLSAEETRRVMDDVNSFNNSVHVSRGQ
jgi:HTH-type transcriptional regulator/antitoxin MqsA